MWSLIQTIFQKMMDVWNYIAYDLLVKVSPGFLHWGSAELWWQNALIGAFWIGLYTLFAWLYFRIVGAPVWRAMAHFRKFDCKVLPWWHIPIYVFIAFYCSHTAIIGTRSLDITPFAAGLIPLLYYVIKLKWRIVYAPLLLLLIGLFWLGAVFVFLPVIGVFLVLMILGVGVDGFISPDRHVCPGCGRVYARTGVCGNCGQTV